VRLAGRQAGAEERVLAAASRSHYDEEIADKGGLTWG
jgi:hypothetical protein